MAKDAKKTRKDNGIDKKDKNVVKDNSKDVSVEKEVKEKKVKSKRNNEKLTNFLKKVDDNRWPIILFVVGFLLATLIFRCIFWPDRIATLKDGTQPVASIKGKTITADDLYKEMKSHYNIDVFLKVIDDTILTKKYPSNSEMETEVKNTADYYYSVYEKNYGYTKETFLSQYGFSNEKEFLESLRLDYRKNKYYDEYVLSLVTDKEVEKYYEDEVFGDVDSKHILVSTGEDGLSDEEAKKLANEIIDKLNKGTSWDDVVKEYKDKIVHEELGYKPYNASLESAYLKECKDLKVGTYSKTPVLTSYGYHIVFKIAQKDKPKLDEVKDDVKDIIADKKKEADNNLYYKALIKMREDASLKFDDTKFEDEYKKHVNQYNK